MRAGLNNIYVCDLIPSWIGVQLTRFFLVLGLVGVSSICVMASTVQLTSGICCRCLLFQRYHQSHGVKGPLLQQAIQQLRSDYPQGGYWVRYIDMRLTSSIFDMGVEVDCNNSTLNEKWQREHLPAKRATLELEAGDLGLGFRELRAWMRLNKYKTQHYPWVEYGHATLPGGKIRINMALEN